MKRLMTLALALAMVSGSGCRLLPSSDRETARTQISREELEVLLDRYADDFSATVQQAADEITEGNPDRDLRRAVTEWKLRTIPACHRIIFQENPIAGLLDAWSLTVRMGFFIASNESREVLGEQRSIAAASARALEEKIEKLASRVLPRKRFAEIRDEIHDFARDHPIRPEVSLEAERPSASLRDLGNETFQWALAIPMAPFRALEGIDQGAQAIQSFTRVADRMGRYLEELPSYARWQAELLLYEFEDSPRLKSLLASFGTVAESSSRLADTASSLPQDVGMVVTGTVDELLAEDAEIRATLGEARAATADARAAVEQLTRTVEEAKGLLEDAAPLMETARTVVDGLDNTADGIARAGTAWEGTIRTYGETVRTLREEGEKGEDVPAGKSGAEDEEESRPFDVTEYAVAADNIARAGDELRKLLEEFNRTLGDPDLETGLTRVQALSLSTVDQAAAASRSVVRHAAFWLAALVVLGFFAAVAFRLLFRGRPITR